MMIQPEVSVIIVLIFLSWIYALLILFGVSRLRKEQIIPLCFIPVFGLFYALVIEYLIYSGKQATKEPDLEGLGLDDEILWATLKSSHEKSDLVPLEEAVLINDVKIRRRSMLETLYSDPTKYLEVLNTAKYNEDIETSHYATTTISKAQKDFQLSIQNYASEVERYPDDPAILDAYIEILGKYIQSGLLEENLLHNLRVVYAQTLDRKLSIQPLDNHALTEKLRNAIELQDFHCAFSVSKQMRDHWPEDEQTWIEALRVCVEGKNLSELNKTIAEIEKHGISWTDQGREKVGPWVRLAAQ
jgi:hypothetical protein